MTEQPRAARLVYLAVGLFTLFWLFLSQSVPVLGEGVSVYPAPAAAALARPSAEDPGPRLQRTCADPGPIRVVTSPDIRPRVSLCVRGRQYPLQIASYASGVPYWITDVLWPFHRGKVFRVRAFGLFFGLLTIALTRRLVARFADPMTANVAALCIAVSPGFLFLHSTLLHHEVLPWLACAAALDQLCRCPALSPRAREDAGAPPTGRLLGASALVGLALLANLKAIFLIAPLWLVALRARVRFSAITTEQRLLAVAVLAAIIYPALAGNAFNAGSDFTRELGARVQSASADPSPLRILRELPNVALFWGDALLFGVLASGDRARPLIFALLPTIPALFYCLSCGVAYLWRGRAALVPAVCGLLILMHVLVSALLYTHYPRANYMPLSAIFGVATAATAVTGARWLAWNRDWIGNGPRRIIVGIAVLALIWGVVGRGSPARYVTMSMNGAAVRALGVHLVSNPEPETPLFVTTYVLAGIPEAVTGGSVRTIKASDYLSCGSVRNTGRPLDAEALELGRRCVQERFERLFEVYTGPIRVLLPVKTTPVDDALAGEYGPALEAAAETAKRTARTEATFEGSGTGPVLRLVRVEPTGGRRRDRGSRRGIRGATGSRRGARRPAGG